MSKKNGTRDEWFTPIPNAVLDEWMPRLSPAELRVVLYVLRRTAGFQKEWDQISLEQMMTGLVGSGGKTTRLRYRSQKDSVPGSYSFTCLSRRASARGGSLEKRCVEADLVLVKPLVDPRTSVGFPTGRGVGKATGGGCRYSDRGEGVGKTTHKRKNSPISPLGGEDDVGEGSTPVSSPKEKVKERKATPPSSSSRGQGWSTNPGEQRRLFDDDGKTGNHSESNGEGEKETRVNGDRSSRAASKSWQELSDDIQALSSERITSEAQELAEALGEKVPRIERGRLERLSLHMVETGNVPHLATVVSSIEKDLKFEARNPWSYLISTLHPLPEAEARNGTTDARESFLSAYESARPARTLGGAARRHHFEGVGSTQPRRTEDYFEEF